MEAWLRARAKSELRHTLTNSSYERSVANVALFGCTVTLLTLLTVVRNHRTVMSTVRLLERCQADDSQCTHEEGR